MAENTRSQKWELELTGLVLEYEKRQNAMLESRLQEMVSDLKTVEAIPGEAPLSSSFPSFDSEGLEGRLLRCEYFFKLGKNNP